MTRETELAEAKLNVQSAIRLYMWYQPSPFSLTSKQKSQAKADDCVKTVTYWWNRYQELQHAG